MLICMVGLLLKQWSNCDQMTHQYLALIFLSLLVTYTQYGSHQDYYYNNTILQGRSQDFRLGGVAVLVDRSHRDPTCVPTYLHTSQEQQRTSEPDLLRCGLAVFP